MTIVRNGVAANLPRVGRKARRPQHTFNLVTRPYGIYPFMIAPVLAGDTLKNALMQSRVVTDPIKDRLIGWWNEYYWFYVKLTDLDDRDTLMNLLINPGQSIAAIDAETAVPVHNFYAATGEGYLNYVEKCLKRVTEDFFCTNDEAWDNVTISGLPVASVVGNSVLDSFINDDAFQTSIEPTVPTDAASVGITGNLQIRNITIMTTQRVI